MREARGTNEIVSWVYPSRKPRKPRMTGSEESPRLERNRVVGCPPPLPRKRGSPPPFPLLGNGHGCWIPDPGSRMLDPRSQIADVGSRIADACSQLADRSPSKGTSGTRDPGSEIRDLGSGIRDPGSGIRDLGPRIRDDLSHRCARTTAGATWIRML